MGAEQKEILQDFVLITYDIPAKESRLRKQVLKTMHAIGAIAYTQSCYLMPFSEKSLALANEIAASGNAVVWVSKQKNEAKAADIIIKYEEHLKIRCDAIRQRLYQIKSHIEAGKLGHAHRMVLKTKTLLNQLGRISETYNPPWLQPELEMLRNLMKQVYTEKE